jgi:hypothetical protein
MFVKEKTRKKKAQIKAAKREEDTKRKPLGLLFF